MLTWILQIKRNFGTSLGLNFEQLQNLGYVCFAGISTSTWNSWNISPGLLATFKQWCFPLECYVCMASYLCLIWPSMPKCVFVAFMPKHFNDHQGVHATSNLQFQVDNLSWALCLILFWLQCLSKKVVRKLQVCVYKLFHDMNIWPVYVCFYVYISYARMFQNSNKT